jgi:hypothetical protein
LRLSTAPGHSRILAVSKSGLAICASLLAHCLSFTNVMVMRIINSVLVTLFSSKNLV